MGYDKIQKRIANDKRLENILFGDALKTSQTVGNGDSDSNGILIDSTGLYGIGPSQTKSNANIRILTDGSGYFSGTFNLAGTTITVSTVDEIYTALTEIETAGGGILYLQNGTYVLTDDIYIPSGVTLQGVSRDTVVLDCNSTFGVYISGTDPYSTGTVTINNGDTTLVGSGTTFTSDMIGQYVLLDGLWYLIEDFTDTTHLEITSYGGVDLSGGVFMIATVNFTGVCSNLTIINSISSGVSVQYAMEPQLTNLLIYGNGIGIDMDYVTYPKIECTSNGNGVNWEANYVEGFFLSFSDINTSTSGNGVTLVNCRNATFFNSSVNDNFGDGINCTNCSKIAFMSFDISGNGGEGVEFVAGCNDNQFTAGVITGNTADGVKFTGTSDRNSFSQISVKDNGAWGINIASADCDNNILMGIIASGNSSGSVTDSGTGTLKNVAVNIIP